ncbi:hypothetical protein SKAU_G00059490 [Synaphobranchus kaupii]|uniref:SCAN box domain-containing protein n=1 Tax=Synaphobranchus kaupii TaxID=118154 RepID=A0A9Q1G5P5_SYNKA|nr:hypothetical protein SKAU_G00059490 [Synaphobranchus kaupii]
MPTTEKVENDTESVLINFEVEDFSPLESPGLSTYQEDEDYDYGTFSGTSAGHLRGSKREELLRVLVESNIGQQRTSQAVVEQAAHLAESLRTRPTILSLLTKMAEGDDVEAYLQTFDSIVEREMWDLKHGRPCLPAPERGDTGAGWTVGHQIWVYQPGVPDRSQMAQLRCLGNCCLQPELLPPCKNVERVVMDRFLRTLPYDAKKLVGQHVPDNPEDMEALVEQVEAMQEMLRAGELPTHRPRGGGD